MTIFSIYFLNDFVGRLDGGGGRHGVRDQSNQFGGKDGKNTPLYPSLCKRNEKVITKFYLVAGGIDIRVRLKKSALHLNCL